MTTSTIQKNFANVLLVSLSVLTSGLAVAADSGRAGSHHTPARAPASIAVQGDLPPLPSDVTDLKFSEFFKMPIGPRGLEASKKLVALSGKRVRILGYMARQETPTAGFFVLAPLPVSLGDEDESLAEDLPASAVFVHFDHSGQALPAPALPYYNGLLHLTGTLRLGPQDEADGHVSTVRLQLDPALAQSLVPKVAGKKTKKQKLV